MLADVQNANAKLVVSDLASMPPVEPDQDPEGEPPESLLKK